MAQHDYNIANQTGANFRADLNNALSAIVSNNSGSSEPSTMYAYEWWIDTSNNVLKLRTRILSIFLCQDQDLFLTSHSKLSNDTENENWWFQAALFHPMSMSMISALSFSS